MSRERTLVGGNDKARADDRTERAHVPCQVFRHTQKQSNTTFPFAGHKLEVLGSVCV